MKQSIILITILLFTSVGLAQTPTESIVRRYMPIKMYKSKFNKQLTKKDSLNIRVIDNDTLILLEDQTLPKGVKVPYEPKDSTFLSYYRKVAFQHKNDIYSNKTSMKYWKNDISIFFSKSISKKSKKEFMSFLKQIDNAVDSLRINEARRLEDSNYAIYYAGDYEYEPRLYNSKTSNYYISWNHNKIYRGAIRLVKNELSIEEMLQFKMREFFIKSLGYFKFIDDFDCDSYFSNCYSPNKKLTLMDLELLKYHYSYGICKGTDLKTFDEQHARAQEVLQKTGQRMYFIHLTENETSE
ncbi:hypothetical protein BXY82_1937 [Gelidibacter sediminis]|uniref:Uncharacterized protein n=1 Tax=Gelidibacter sediminis TaxID=1608710 RepID=A0A4R7Q0F9_9FLAO|nr:hypothetical protein [Gelidibacter sediminis]TDU39900.1 hypothetical protein BXY82_1937 [Gelidibacter sediminis]